MSQFKKNSEVVLNFEFQQQNAPHDPVALPVLFFSLFDLDKSLPNRVRNAHAAASGLPGEVELVVLPDHMRGLELTSAVGPA